MRGNYTVVIEATIRDLAPREEGSTWQEHQPGYALMGIGFGSRCLHESWVGNDSLRNLLGHIYYSLGKHEEALAEYRAAFHLAPRRPGFKTNYEVLHTKLQREKRPH